MVYDISVSRKCSSYINMSFDSATASIQHKQTRLILNVGNNVSIINIANSNVVVRTHPGSDPLQRPTDPKCP